MKKAGLVGGAIAVVITILVLAYIMNRSEVPVSAPQSAPELEVAEPAATEEVVVVVATLAPEVTPSAPTEAVAIQGSTVTFHGKVLLEDGTPAVGAIKCFL